ncbi:MAG: diadenylate cyclase CdaA [Bacteroidales bacterium]|nr:diadenylate cyclase CdaA [Bacteroidales bacterium]
MTPLLALQGLPKIHVIDIIDIVLVAALIYEIYRMLRGTNALRIFWAIVIIYVAYLITTLLNMRLSSGILDQVVSIGLIALIIIFQPEIRRLLLLVGTKTSIAGDSTRKRFMHWRRHITNSEKSANIEPYIQACMHMSQSKTGGLICFMRQNDVSDLVATGERLDALASSALIENIFFKNTPLHDGALFVKGSTLVAARCILPVSSNSSISPSLGLRHRSAIGVTEQSDVISVVVSEETGAISYAVEGIIHHDVTPVQLRQFLEKELSA